MLQKLLDFVHFTDQFRAVERHNLIKNTDRQENDAEHSYQLALTAWYLLDADKLPLNRAKVLELALAHDLVETYAGDTYLYGSGAHYESKAEREAAALTQLQENFPNFPSLYPVIAEYESHSTPESRFVYALDKVLPIMETYLDNGRVWQKEKVTLQMIIQQKKDKVALSPEIIPYFNELISLLEQKPELFPPQTSTES